MTGGAHGGSRPGSGRKPLSPSGSVAVSVWMSPLQRELFRRAGGAKWLRRVLEGMSAADAISGREVIRQRVAAVTAGQDVPAVAELRSKAGGKVKWVSASAAGSFARGKGSMHA